MRNLGGVNHKTVVQVVVIQSILETLRLIKSKTYIIKRKNKYEGGVERCYHLLANFFFPLNLLEFKNKINTNSDTLHFHISRMIMNTICTCGRYNKGRS